MHMQTNHNLYLDKNRLKGVMMLIVNVGLLWIFFKSVGSIKTPTGQKGGSKSLFQLEETYGR